MNTAERFPTIEDRIKRARRCLTMIVNVQSDDGLDEGEDLIEAIQEFASDAMSELYWVSRLPELVRNLPAPTDDDLDGVLGQYPDDTDAALEALLRRCLEETEKAKSGAR